MRSPSGPAPPPAPPPKQFHPPGAPVAFPKSEMLARLMSEHCEVMRQNVEAKQRALCHLQAGPPVNLGDYQHLPYGINAKASSAVPPPDSASPSPASPSIGKPPRGQQRWDRQLQNFVGPGQAKLTAQVENPPQVPAAPAAEQLPQPLPPPQTEEDDLWLPDFVPSEPSTASDVPSELSTASNR